MRMWMIPPKILCQKHLCGEHVETHMFLGHLKRKRKIDGYLKNNCLEMTSLYKRHRELADEMLSRGYKHNSPMYEWECNACIHHYPMEQIIVSVDKDDSFDDLIGRCSECRKRLNMGDPQEKIGR